MRRNDETPERSKGARLRAEIRDATGASPVQLRILGDDARGYLLAGAVGADKEDEEFWFSTLDEAFAAANRLGVPRESWREITEPSQVSIS